MTEPSAQVIADSINYHGHRLTTMVVTMHRFVLAEFNTHRVFSRNSASSRAIPVEAQIRRGLEDPAYPVVLPCEQPGMSGGATLEGDDYNDAFFLLADIRSRTLEAITDYIDRHPDKATRLHKSILNRPMEWFQWHTVVVTSTEWKNFFDLRVHPAAQPEMREAATAMMEAYYASKPQELGPGDWHTPFIDDETVKQWGVWSLEAALKTSAARCAWVSTMKHGRDATWEDIEDIYTKLTAGLKDGEPVHASPFEHQATPALSVDQIAGRVEGNFKGWHQLRHMIERGREPWRGMSNG